MNKHIIEKLLDKIQIIHDRLNLTCNKSEKDIIESLKSTKNYINKIIKKFIIMGTENSFTGMDDENFLGFAGDFSHKYGSRDDANFLRKRKRDDAKESNNKTPKLNENQKQTRHRRTQLQIAEDDLVLLRQQYNATPNNLRIQEKLHAKEKQIEEYKLRNHKNNDKIIKKNNNKPFCNLDNKTPNKIAKKLIDKSKKLILQNSSKKKNNERVYDEELNNQIIAKRLTTYNYTETEFDDSVRIELETEQASSSNYFTLTDTASSANSSFLINMAHSNLSSDVNNDSYAAFENINSYGYAHNNYYTNNGVPSKTSNVMNNLNKIATTATTNRQQSQQQLQQQTQQQLHQQNTQPNQQHMHNSDQINQQQTYNLDQNIQKQYQHNLMNSQNGLNKGLFSSGSQNKLHQNLNNISNDTENEIFNINNQVKSNASKIVEINNEVEFLLNNRTLLFEGQHLHNYRQNYVELTKEFNKNFQTIQLAEISIIDVGYDTNGKQVPKRLWDTVKILRSICYLKVVFFECKLDDYIKIRDSKNIHLNMFGGIKRINNNMNLSIHVSVPNRINLNDEDIIKNMQEYGVKDIKRSNNSSICKMEMVDVKSWANLCKYGIRVRNKHYVCKYWENNLKKCRKCLMFGHIEGDVKCEERCKKCGEKTHKGNCSSSYYNCVNCRKIGTHTHDNLMECTVHKTKKAELNSKYEKIMRLLNIQIESYNTKPNYDKPSINNQNIDPSTLEQMLASSAYLNKNLGEIRDTVTQVQNEVRGIKKVEVEVQGLYKYLDRIDNKLDKYFNGDKNKTDGMDSETSTNGTVTTVDGHQNLN
jgi:hypothetical protein